MLDPLEDWICIDVETTSFLDLRDVTADVYAQHESTHVYTAVIGKGYAAGGDTVLEMWKWRPGLPLDYEVAEFIKAGGRVVAWNAGFERAIWRHILAPKYGWPIPELNQWRDVQANSVAMALPASLEKAAEVVFGADDGDYGDLGKDKQGAALMKKMAQSVPSADGEWIRPHENDANLRRLEAYCATDVVVTGRLYENLCALTLTELRVWLCDQEINDRGIYVDRDRARRMISMVNQRDREITSEVFSITEGKLAGVRSIPALKKWLHEKIGRSLTDSLSKADVAELLKQELPPLVRQVLELRQEASRITSLGKLKRIRHACSPDGRVRGALAYHRAHTGRWSSRLLQVHNLPKDRRSRAVQELCALAIDEGDYDTLDMLWSPLEALSLGLRSLIAAPPGHELIAADYSAIEARVLPWLAGDTDKLQLFRDGVDTYVKAAADVGSTDRQLGKVCELALGYGMGAGKFAATANSWGVPLSTKQAYKITKTWRAKNKSVPAFWAALESAVKNCIRTAGHAEQVGGVTVASGNNGPLVYIKLPSGRYLWYHEPEIRYETRTVDIVRGDGTVEPTTMEFESIYFSHANAGRWSRTSTYGGKLVENVTQAVARDCLAAALLRLRDTKYKVVMHVHDSIVSEVAEGTGDVAEFEQLILDMPQWAKGLPLAAEGYRGPRFIG